MSRQARVLKCLLAALLPLLVAGCLGSPGTIAWRDPSRQLAWPAPPQPPRIQYLRSLHGPEDFQAKGRSGSVLRWMTGEKTQGIALLAPYGVAADGQGRVWVADVDARLVHVFDLGRRRVDYLTVAGSQPFQSPLGVAFDPGSERLYVSDSLLNKVFVLDAKQGKLLGSVAPPGGFGRPGGLAVDRQGRLYVVDVLQSKVLIFSRDGQHVKSLTSLARKDEGFNRPANVFVDRAGRIYVTDSLNFQVEVFGSDGEALGVIGGLGDAPGSFARPRGVAVDSQGHIYVADASFDNIQIFDLAGRLLLVLGSSGKEAGEFSLPAGLFVDQNDRLYVVDAYNRRVQLFQYLPPGGGKP